METEGAKPSRMQRRKRRDKRMGEEVIECYRRGPFTKHGKGYKKRLERAGEDDLGARESIKARHTGERRHPSDNLEPLVRYLRSHVGKHWDGVYSDLCRSLDAKSMTGQHVIGHLKDFVHVHVVKEGKRLISLDGGTPQEIGEWYWRPRFYVHPKSGVLLEAPDRRKARRIAARSLTH